MELGKALYDFVTARQGEAADRVLKCPYYRAVRDEEAAAEERLRSRLGPEEWKEYLKLTELHDWGKSILEDEIYLQGFRDALALVLGVLAPAEGRTLYALRRQAEGRTPEQEAAPSSR